MQFFALRDRRDRIEVALTVVPPLAWWAWPHPGTVALAVWWLGNTVSHHAVHRRFFLDARAERAFAVWLSLGIGVPQQVWAQRHLGHHAPARARVRWSRQLGVEVLALAVLWSVGLGSAGWSWLWVYATGLGGGLLLAALHGHYEHRGGTTDIRARWWNVCMWNDGLHGAHHAAPGRHWRDLRTDLAPAAKTSRLPPPLRWLRSLSLGAVLDAAEHLVLRWPWLQQRVLAAHRRAMDVVLAGEAAPQSIVVVGGGLFPRSVLLLHERYPRAQITVWDENAAHLAAARPLLPDGVVVREQRFTPGAAVAADLVVVPLALRGARQRVLAEPPAARVLVHDWAWRRRGLGCVVAWWLGKRLYLRRTAPARAQVQTA